MSKRDNCLNCSVKCEDHFHISFKLGLVDSCPSHTGISNVEMVYSRYCNEGNGECNDECFFSFLLVMNCAIMSPRFDHRVSSQYQKYHNTPCLNNNTLYILSLVLMFLDKGFFT